VIPVGVRSGRSYERERVEGGAAYQLRFIHSLTLVATGRLFLLLGLVTFSLHAGPVESSIVAIMRLSEQPNYSWVATISDDARTYDVVGQTERGGFSRVKMPVVNTVRRQLGRSVTDTDIDLIYRGNIECVIETEHGWRKVSELSQMPSNDTRSASGAAGSFPGIYPSNTRTTRGRTAKGSNPRDSGPRAYSNLQLGLSLPHEELGVIVGSHVEFKVDGDMVTGKLTDLGAQLLLVRDGQDNLQPLRASGTFRIWLRGGMVSKYQLKLEGVLEVQLSSGPKQIQVQQTTDTVVKDIGTTRFEIPEQARDKLGK
jgi:hypothetical protein